MQEKRVTLNWFGKELVITTGKMAKQANGSVTVQYDDTVILAAATMGKNLEEDPGFFPLSVHYLEKYYASGRLPGGFIKRESKPSDRAILTSRIIDRSLRPLFQEGFRNEVQIIPMLVSSGNCAADILASLASSAALYISDIPFTNPVGTVRVSLVQGEIKVNTDASYEDNEELNLLISGTEDGITMIEGISSNVTNEQMVSALKLGFEEIQKLIQIQKDLKVLAGKEKIKTTLFLKDPALEKAVADFASEKILKTFSIKEKLEHNKAVEKVFEDTVAHFKALHENNPSIEKQVKELVHDLEYFLVRDYLFEHNIRVDGRRPDELRHIEAEVGLFRRLHGSALFTRGETQSLGVLTLGSSSDEQRVDSPETGDSSKRYMLHYNFPSFCVGEAGKVGPPGRREIGHGYLAEKALKMIIPKEEDFSYTIRLVSEILESNGSSSMASVCSGSLALMDGGVPIKEHVAGIAMGLMFNKDNTDYKILTDIQGLEDHYGDIDFKVAGTKTGITAFQLDIKMNAVSLELLKDALESSLKARLHILDIMNKVISSPRNELSEFAPKIFSIFANPDNIRHLIGPGGKTIKALTEEFHTNIDILPTGEIRIISAEPQLTEELKKRIQFMVRDIKVGDIIEGKVTKIVAFGAFIELAAGREGLCHISKLANRHVKAVTDILSEGMMVTVKVTDIDAQGKIAVSLKDV
jgi:polyribonucleotide nucleotidyltransferase